MSEELKVLFKTNSDLISKYKAMKEIVLEFQIDNGKLKSENKLLNQTLIDLTNTAQDLSFVLEKYLKWTKQLRNSNQYYKRTMKVLLKAKKKKRKNSIVRLVTFRRK